MADELPAAAMACAACGVAFTLGPHLCEHGVTTSWPSVVEMTATVNLNADQFASFLRGLYGDAAD